MQFVYSSLAKFEFIFIEDDLYHYLFRVHRFKISENIYFRNFQDIFLYKYEIVEINKKTAKLKLIEKIEKPNRPKRFFHFLWCVVEPKTIEKNLHFFNEIGVSKITFIFCDRSQKNFEINLERLNKILISSSEQCGRGDIIELELLNSIDEALKKYENINILNFGGKLLENNLNSILIGCEGGFTNREISLFDKKNSFGLECDFILKSETASIVSISKILL